MSKTFPKDDRGITESDRACENWRFFRDQRHVPCGFPGDTLSFHILPERYPSTPGETADLMPIDHDRPLPRGAGHVYIAYVCLRSRC
jgi:hypothetical protein